MATLGDLKAKIALEIHRSDVTTEIGSAVLSAVKHYESQRFWFNEASTSFVTTSGVSSYSANTITNYFGGTTSLDPVIEFDLVTVTLNGRPIELIPKPWQDLASISQSSSNGIPKFYGWRAEYMLLYPTPNAAYTIGVHYLRAPNDLTGDTDQNIWTNQAVDLIRHRAKVELYEGSLINPAKADRERILEAETLAKLLKRTNEMSATNTLKGDL